MNKLNLLILPWEKLLKVKTIEDQGVKQVKALKTFKPDNEKLTIEDVIPKSALNNDKAKKELDKIKEIDKTIDRERLVYKASEYTYNFRNFWTVRTLGRDIYEGRITLEEANIDQDNLLRDIRNFNNETRPQNDNKIQEKKIVLKSFYKFFEAREVLLDGFYSKIFLIKSKGLGLLNADRSKLKY